MAFWLFLEILAATLYASPDQWQSLETCIKRLKTIEKSISSSMPLRSFVTLDPRLHQMVEGIRYSESNAGRLRVITDGETSDKWKSYLVSNAAVSCENDESRLGNYLGGLKRFLIMFFITTLSLSCYTAYIFFHLITLRNKALDKPH